MMITEYPKQIFWAHTTSAVLFYIKYVVNTVTTGMLAHNKFENSGEGIGERPRTKNQEPRTKNQE